MTKEQQYPKDKKTYLGDGVYAHHDGYHVWVSVNHHNNTVVALEPSVLQNLISFAELSGLREKK